MTLGGTVGHIQAVDGVDRSPALFQFRMARADGDLPARWAADPLSPDIFTLGDDPLPSNIKPHIYNLWDHPWWPPHADEDLPARWAADPLSPEIYNVGDDPSSPDVGRDVYTLGDPWPFSSDEVPTDPSYWFSVLIFFNDDDAWVVDQPGTCFSETQEHPLPRPRQLFLLRSRVLELWPPSNHERKDQNIQVEKPARRSVGDDEIRSTARDIYREIDRPNKAVAERLVRQRLGGGKRDDIRRILDEKEFVRRDPGNQLKKPNLRNS